MLVSGAVNREFELRGWVKPKTIKLLFTTYPLSKQHWGVRRKTGCLVIMIMCPSGAICLPQTAVSVRYHYKNPSTVSLLVKYKADIIISSKCNVFSLWYSWAIWLPILREYFFVHLFVWNIINAEASHEMQKS